MRTTLLPVAGLVIVVLGGGCEQKEVPPRDVGAAGRPKAPAVTGEKRAAPKAQTICPVMGEKIDKTLYVDHMGKRVFFCCKMCVGKFNKDPMKYIKKLEEQGVTLEDAPTAR